MEDLRKVLAPYGAFKSIAQEVGVSRQTVRMAIRYNQSGRKSEQCRQLFYEKYIKV